ncbi:hypothetical protein ACM66B_002613 [Microbotryomycetes sp. NB124-2]
MSSFVFYRFKSQKEPSRISFDGTGISVWDLKKEIIQENKMGKGTDFDFAIYNADTEEEYTEDHQIIPRSTSVLARRLPPARPGRGNAQKYMPSMEGSGPTGSSNSYAHMGQGKTWNASQFTKRFDGKEDSQAAAPQAPVEVKLPAAAGEDEASALAAMFAASSQQWQQTQEQMAQATPVYRAPQARAPGASQRPVGSAPGLAGPPSASASNPAVFIPGTGPDSTTASRYHQDRQAYRYSEHKPPPPGYICYRCGQKGHWIQECPTNSDRAFDDRPRIKRTTGIPKSFLTVVEGPDAPTEGATPGASGIMVTAEGGFVVAKPDSASWLAHRAHTKNLSAKDVQDLAPTDPDLTCPICSKLLRDAMLTPCCSTSFCQECIENALIDNDKLCPECETRIKSLDKLKVDEERRERVKKYIDDVVEASKEVKEEDAEGDGETQDGEPKNEDGGEDEKKLKTEDGGVDAPTTTGQNSDEQTTSNGVNSSTATTQSGPPMNPQAFAAQQLALQQQQMMQLMIAQAGGPQMMMQQLQAQVMALSMQLQNNPNLPPPVRVQMMAQVQMCQQQYFVVQRMVQQQFQQQQQQMMAARNNGGRQGSPAQTNVASPVVARSGTPQAQDGINNKRSRGDDEAAEEQRKKSAVAG